MPLQLNKIASIEVATPQSSVTFSSIPQGYTDLKIVLTVRTSGASGSDQTLIKFNGSTTGYTAKLLGGTGSAINSPSIAQYVVPNNTTGQTASAFNSGEVYIPAYTSANNKNYCAEGAQENNGTAAYMWLTAGAWANTAAITSIELYPSADFYVANSTFTLYGIL